MTTTSRCRQSTPASRKDPRDLPDKALGYPWTSQCCLSCLLPVWLRTRSLLDIIASIFFTAWRRLGEKGHCMLVLWLARTPIDITQLVGRVRPALSPPPTQLTQISAHRQSPYFHNCNNSKRNIEDHIPMFRQSGQNFVVGPWAFCVAGLRVAAPIQLYCLRDYRIGVSIDLHSHHSHQFHPTKMGRQTKDTLPCLYNHTRGNASKRTG